MCHALGLLVVTMCVTAALVYAREIQDCTCMDDIVDCSFRERPAFGPKELCRGIQKINLQSNYLHWMPEGMKNFVEIDLSKNVLKNLPDLSTLSEKTKVLDVSSNEIEYTSNELKALSALEILYIQDNYIKSLDFLPQKCVLKSLNASFNNLTKLDGPLEKCELMKILVLSNNNIIFLPDGVFSQMIKLETLDLSNNKFIQICNGLFNGLYSLKYLRLNGNRLTSLSGMVFSELPQVVDLDLSDNPLTRVTPWVFNGLEKLKTITMGVKTLGALPHGLFVGLGRLQKLALDVGNVTTLPQYLFKPLRHLEQLDLLGAGLSKLPAGLLSPLAQLKTLNLIGSQVRLLPDGLFSGLHALGAIDLRSNRLSALPVLQDCCVGLWFADFSNNSITDPSEEALRGLLRPDVTVHLGGNPLRPDALRWAVLAADMQHFLGDGDCACGGIRHGNATVDFCVDARCHKEAGFRNWVSAVRATSPDAL